MRRRYLINARFQVAFMGYMGVIAGLVLAILYGANRYFFWRLAEYGLKSGLPRENVYFQFLADQASFMNSVFLFTAFAVLGVVIIAGLWISHRIAGPIYHALVFLDELAAGREFKPIRFRSRDHFPELADALNRALGSKKS